MVCIERELRNEMLSCCTPALLYTLIHLYTYGETRKKTCSEMLQFSSQGLKASLHDNECISP